MGNIFTASDVSQIAPRETRRLGKQARRNLLNTRQDLGREDGRILIDAAVLAPLSRLTVSPSHDGTLLAKRLLGTEWVVTDSNSQTGCLGTG
jgi:hypothetical protein